MHTGALLAESISITVHTTDLSAKDKDHVHLQPVMSQLSCNVAQRRIYSNNDHNIHATHLLIYKTIIYVQFVSLDLSRYNTIRVGLIYRTEHTPV